MLHLALLGLYATFRLHSPLRCFESLLSLSCSGFSSCQLGSSLCCLIPCSLLLGRCRFLRDPCCCRRLCRRVLVHDWARSASRAWQARQGSASRNLFVWRLRVPKIGPAINELERARPIPTSLSTWGLAISPLIRLYCHSSSSRALHCEPCARSTVRDPLPARFVCWFLSYERLSLSSCLLLSTPPACHTSPRPPIILACQRPSGPAHEKSSGTAVAQVAKRRHVRIGRRTFDPRAGR